MALPALSNGDQPNQGKQQIATDPQTKSSRHSWQQVPITVPTGQLRQRRHHVNQQMCQHFAHESSNFSPLEEAVALPATKDRGSEIHDSADASTKVRNPDGFAGSPTNRPTNRKRRRFRETTDRLRTSGRINRLLATKVPITVPTIHH
jgi:hypothetical protein